MGGFGSGRSTGRGSTSGLLAIDVRMLGWMGAVAPGALRVLTWTMRGEHIGTIVARGDDDVVTVSYRGGGERHECSVALERTPCGWGGSRH